MGTRTVCDSNSTPPLKELATYSLSWRPTSTGASRDAWVMFFCAAHITSCYKSSCASHSTSECTQQNSLPLVQRHVDVRPHVCTIHCTPRCTRRHARRGSRHAPHHAGKRMGGTIALCRWSFSVASANMNEHVQAKRSPIPTQRPTTVNICERCTLFALETPILWKC